MKFRVFNKCQKEILLTTHKWLLDTENYNRNHTFQLYVWERDLKNTQVVIAWDSGDHMLHILTKLLYLDRFLLFFFFLLEDNYKRKYHVGT